MTHYIRRPGLRQDRGQALIETAIAQPAAAARLGQHFRVWPGVSDIAQVHHECRARRGARGGAAGHERRGREGPRQELPAGRRAWELTTAPPLRWTRTRRWPSAPSTRLATMVNVDYPFSFMVSEPGRKARGQELHRGRLDSCPDSAPRKCATRHNNHADLYSGTIDCGGSAAMTADFRSCSWASASWRCFRRRCWRSTSACS